MLIKSLTKVDKLTQRVEGVFDQRQADEDRHKREQARLKEVSEAQDITKMDFWCNRCNQDTTGLGYKVVFKNEDGFCAYYESFGSRFPKEMLTCCKGLRRNITDKQWDKYYLESEMIIKQAREAQANGDFLQPHQDGFRTKYGDPNKKLYEKMEKEERANFTKGIRMMT